MGVETVLLGASLLGAGLQASSASKARKQAEKAAKAEQEKNDRILTEQRNAALLEGQAEAVAAQVDAAGSAEASAEEGFAGGEIKRRKRPLADVAQSLGI